MSPLLQTNLTDVDPSGPPQLAAQYYPALTIRKASVGRDDAKGYLWLDVSLVDGNEQVPGMHSERFFISADPQENWKLKRLLIACGKDDLAQADEWDPDDLTGASFRGIITMRSYTKDGETKEATKLAKILLAEDPDPATV